MDKSRELLNRALTECAQGSLFGIDYYITLALRELESKKKAKVEGLKNWCESQQSNLIKNGLHRCTKEIAATYQEVIEKLEELDK